MASLIERSFMWARLSFNLKSKIEAVTKGKKGMPKNSGGNGGQKSNSDKGGQESSSLDSLGLIVWPGSVAARKRKGI